MKKFIFVLTLLFPPALLPAQEIIDEDANAKIRTEAADHSRAMHTLHVLADRYGPRLTGSPNHEAAARWAVKELSAWGLENARLEPWDFGHPGWANERAEGAVLSPLQDSLNFRVAAWTPSTQGTVAASAVQIIPPKGTDEELTAWLAANRSKVQGKIVLVGKAAAVSSAPFLRRPGEAQAGERRAIRQNAEGPDTDVARPAPRARIPTG